MKSGGRMDVALSAQHLTDSQVGSLREWAWCTRDALGIASHDSQVGDLREGKECLVAEERQLFFLRAFASAFFLPCFVLGALCSAE